VSPRAILVVVFLVASAIGSWYLGRSPSADSDDDLPFESIHRGYYLKDARILGTGDDGDLLYEIGALYIEQMENARIELTQVRVRYLPASNISWTVNADAATLHQKDSGIQLRGNVYAVSGGDDEDKTEILTQILDLDPEQFVARTDARVQIRFGGRSLSATGMLASLNDDTIELKSNIRAKFVP
jgi:LPS export ABC transporter protein LptC